MFTACQIAFLAHGEPVKFPSSLWYCEKSQKLFAASHVPEADEAVEGTGRQQLGVRADGHGVDHRAGRQSALGRTRVAVPDAYGLVLARRGKPAAVLAEANLMDGDTVAGLKLGALPCRR